MEFDKLRKRVKKVDQTTIHKASEIDDIWQKVSLPEEEKQIRKPYLKFAAAISLLVLCTYIFWPQDSDTNVRYYTEVHPNMPTISTDVDEVDFEELGVACKTQEQPCDPKLLTLFDELESINQNISELNEMISQYGKGPSLVKSEIELQNFKSDIQRQIITLILS